MSWTAKFRAGLAALGAAAALAVAGTIVVAGPGGTGQAAGASVTQGMPASAAAAVTYRVSGTAQRAALAFWSSARMRAARPLLAMGKAALQDGGLSEQAGSTMAKPPKGIPAATKFNGVPTAGALFYTTRSHPHFCTASVVDSRAGDLLLTAAHCVYDKSPVANIAYVPEYHDGHHPYGIWLVSAITVASGWRLSHDADFDFAFLTVSAQGGKQIQARTGGLTIAFHRHFDEKIEVIGDNDTDSAPVHCATKSFEFSPAQMEFYCYGFRTGTSGSPWIMDYNARTGAGSVFGVIGGYEAGGDYDWASYSSYFGDAARTLYRAAASPPPPPPQPSPSPRPTPTGTPTPTASPSPAST